MVGEQDKLRNGLAQSGLIGDSKGSDQWLDLLLIPRLKHLDRSLR